MLLLCGSIYKELAYKIKRHEKNILNTIEQELSNARIESINNKIKLVIRKAYGFRNIQNMIDMILLACSEIKIPLPNRGINQWKNSINNEVSLYFYELFTHNYARYLLFKL